MPDRKSTTNSRRMEIRRRRGPRTTVAGRPKARRPQFRTLTLQKFQAAFTESLTLFPAVKVDDKGHPVEHEDEPTLDGALARRRATVEDGDLLALYTALEWSHVDRFGWPGIFTIHESGEGRSHEVQMPRWLLVALLRLVWRGIHGRWPKKKGRHSTAAGRLLDAQAHLGRTHWVLRARDEGVPWAEVFRVVSERLKKEGRGNVSPRALEASYRLVARAFKSEKGLSHFRFAPRFPVPQDWGP